MLYSFKNTIITNFNLSFFLTYQSLSIPDNFLALSYGNAAVKIFFPAVTKSTPH